jgi:hypothetical protein
MERLEKHSYGWHEDEDSFAYGVRGIREWAGKHWKDTALIGAGTLTLLAFIYYSDVGRGVKHPGAMDYIPGNCSNIESVVND